jgi:hypothetical protein
VLIGAALTVVLGAFALVPTDSLRIMKPTKPLFLYLIPLIRIQARAMRVPLPSLVPILGIEMLCQKVSWQLCLERGN